MPLTFAFKWNWDYDNEKSLVFNGSVFTHADARTLLRSAVTHPNGNGLKTEIDTGLARVVKGPHKTPGGDTRSHMTVHCKNMRAIYHVYISRQGNLSGVDQEHVSGMTPKTGHAKDDASAPTISNSAAL